MVLKRQDRQLNLLPFISDSNIKAFKQSNSLRFVCLLFLLIIYIYIVFLNCRCAFESQIVNLFDVSHLNSDSNLIASKQSVQQSIFIFTFS
jgi:hypothetical protein